MSNPDLPTWKELSFKELALVDAMGRILGSVNEGYRRYSANAVRLDGQGYRIGDYPDQDDAKRAVEFAAEQHRKNARAISPEVPSIRGDANRASRAEESEQDNGGFDGDSDSDAPQCSAAPRACYNCGGLPRLTPDRVNGWACSECHLTVNADGSKLAMSARDIATFLHAVANHMLGANGVTLNLGYANTIEVSDAVHELADQIRSLKFSIRSAI